ncbi:unnamed protein product [Euphydryas editha]|uniref:Uncharacterized protein n=1 Tax=Euphydryas editha TaxID=104508 RepID=A0AAU9UEI1_EUPED|nr:unnamed protein product [Euphydryas editha]
MKRLLISLAVLCWLAGWVAARSEGVKQKMVLLPGPPQDLTDPTVTSFRGNVSEPCTLAYTPKLILNEDGSFDPETAKVIWYKSCI